MFVGIAKSLIHVHEYKNDEEYEAELKEGYTLYFIEYMYIF